MFVGTCSDAGKSLVNAGFCRVFKQDGFNPAPFKAQNMSLNSYATPEGLEIGRAQAVQAEACQTAPSVYMNPVLLKPTGEMKSQIVLLGKPVGDQSAYAYFKENDRAELFEAAVDSFQKLNAQFNPIVMEGAGSISELNLKKRDITNMRIALRTGADVYLVADIDRGGIFGSVYGTIALLTQEEKEAVKGIIVNKFRGDARLFEEGKQILEELTGKPVVGVLPHFADLYIEEEDSVSLTNKNKHAIAGKVNIAVVRLEQLSNFTDFNALSMHPSVHLYYTLEKEELKNADIIILPGSKNTIADLNRLKSLGVDQEIQNAYRNGKTVIGICGGYQMMGVAIKDPDGIEGAALETEGLCLLPVETVLENSKVTEQGDFYFKDQDELCHGYEIHMGKTNPVNEAYMPVNKLPDGSDEGCWVNEKCWGSYFHGILDNQVVINELLGEFGVENHDFDYVEYKEKNYDQLADYIRQYMDLDYIYKLLKR
ncbi:cobyric acid synthase [Saccharicrinis fermentans DSM 9555 = JCM 21142]|uniref:Cobyric acid synthase n=2 Tax=Saccharicrinis fermentans TaxID=982 RepID=W7YP25_9BACT|nr:cobyric acid synthase [Saccharicrinis fermentans DSM 9555 = JCM 21142]